MGAPIRRGNLPSELGFLIDQLDDFERRIDIIEGFDANQANGTLGKLRRAVADIAAQQIVLNDLVANLEARMTAFIETDVEALVASKVAAALAALLAGNVSIGGALSVAGPVSLPGARGTGLATASDRVTAWIAGDGRLGHTAA